MRIYEDLWGFMRTSVSIPISIWLVKGRNQWHQILGPLSASVEIGPGATSYVLAASRLVKMVFEATQMARFPQDGAPKIAKLPYFSGFMVDITIVNRGYNGL